MTGEIQEALLYMVCIDREKSLIKTFDMYRYGNIGGIGRFPGCFTGDYKQREKKRKDIFSSG